MSIRLGVVMDPLSAIHFKKDSTLAMLWEAEKRGWIIHYFQPQDLSISNGQPYGVSRVLHLTHDEAHWHRLDAPVLMPLAELDIILMRQDPPVNDTYLYTTCILEQAERLGVLVANRPQAVRDANEKLFATLFSECAPTHLVTADRGQLHAFLSEHKDIVCKPLNSMGGTSIFRVKAGDVNTNVIFDTLTFGGQITIMAQVFLPAISAGDKRILMINGEPIPYALARVPQGSEWRGNLAVGAKGVVQALSDADRRIASIVGPVLRERGLYFVGLDVIGEHLTEINVTSPTGVREIEAATQFNAASALLDCLIKLKH
jgi:glutathione synthase